METRTAYAQSPYDPLGSHGEVQRLMVDPTLPLPTAHAREQELPGTSNGVERTSSKRRRPVGSGVGESHANIPVQPPAAPEAPRAPPLSYRPPPVTNGYPRSNLTYPTSFAQRARTLTGQAGPPDSGFLGSQSAEQPRKRERRASLNRPIGGVYAEIQQHKRDSLSSTGSGPTSPRRSSYPAKTSNLHSPEIASPKVDQTPATVQPAAEVSPPSSQATARRISPPTEKQPPKKEWASDRSPLQNLESTLNNISKEEKRARVQQAEERLRKSRPSPLNQSGTPSSTVDRTPSKRVSTDPRGVPVQGGNSSSIRASSDPASAQHGIGSRHRDQNPTRSDAAVSREAPEGTRPARANTSSQRGLEPNGVRTNPRSEQDRKPSVRLSNTSPSGNHPERGVRFQKMDDPLDATEHSPQPARSDSQRRKQALDRLDLDPASAEARAARRDQLRQDSAMPERHFGNGEAFVRRPDNPQDRRSLNNAAIASGKSASGNATDLDMGHVGGSTKDTPSDRKHHLSDALHWRQNRRHDVHDHADTRLPQPLNEWKSAGVARLTATDFLDDEEPVEEQKAWWERGGSGRQRRSQRNSRKMSTDIGTDQTTYQGNTGESARSPLQASVKSTQPSESTNVIPVRARPYMRSEDREGSQTDLVSSFKHQASLFRMLLRRNQDEELSSFYSYSCPELAYHNSLHPEHVCDPNVSKELTQRMRSVRTRPVPGSTTFSPPLYLKCGPLLRYTGMKRERADPEKGTQSSKSDREIWRGSVMIVTTDAQSNYKPVPTLRLFPEPMDLVPPPPQNIDAQDRGDMPSEFSDPIAGLPKLSRTGKTIYVKPVDDLGEAVDLSHLETDDGLFEETRTAAVPTAYGTPDYHHGRNGNQLGKGAQNARKPKRGHRVRGVRLHAERGITFWRFNIEVELGAEQTRIAYSINNGPAVGFWVPAKGQSMNIMFHSCNGFSASVNPDDFSGPDPLWRDVLNSHQTRPFHVMIGGGDQIYNDAVMRQSPLFGDWLDIKNPHHKHEAPFTPAMEEELETFYLEHYSMWFSQGLFGMANSQIAMVNIWDDHDIIDGFGSYPDHFMSTPVFMGIGGVAFKYYMLFQHQSVPAETAADEPSWLLGAANGPYIKELSRSIFVSLGKHVAFLGLDCRTERRRDEILTEASYDIVLDRCRREIVKGETKHLIVLLGVPIAYPRLVWLENLLTSRVMDPVKALGRVGLFGNFLNKFDGGVEILDDLDDHWTARSHKQERNWFIEELQELAAELSVRITILGGDVHLAAVGQFFSNPKLKIPKDHDHRYMANIISSAIVNTPPPEMMGDILNKRNKTHHLDPDTDENMIPMFTHDVDGKPRNNKRLLPRRNWCSIREYYPGSTPPPTPPSSEPETDSDSYDPPPLRVRLQRTMSLTREEVRPGNLIRRLSGRGPPSPSVTPPEGDPTDSPPPPEDVVKALRQRISASASNAQDSPDVNHNQASAPLPRPGHFHRMPTNFSEKAVLKGNANPHEGHINLENGLDIVINCEINQRDPAGTTTPYRLLIPALWHEGPEDVNTLQYRRASVFSRLGSLRVRRNRNRPVDAQGQGNWGQESQSGDESEREEEPRPRRWSFGLTQRRQYRDQTPPGQRADETQEGLQEFDGAGLPYRAEPGPPRNERPQQQQQNGQSGHRNHQQTTAGRRMGNSDNLNDHPPAASRQQALAKLTGHQQLNGNGSTSTTESSPRRRDSVDYHEHLDVGPRPAQGQDQGQAQSSQRQSLQLQQQQVNGNGRPVRRLSKIERMLGATGSSYASRGAATSTTNGGGGRVQQPQPQPQPQLQQPPPAVINGGGGGRGAEMNGFGPGPGPDPIPGQRTQSQGANGTASAVGGGGPAGGNGGGYGANGYDGHDGYDEYDDPSESGYVEKRKSWRRFFS